MRRAITALAVGALFGAGLTLSDMANPARVQAFLDIAGAWDPTLLLVMAAAIVPSAAAYVARRRLAQPVLGGTFDIPVARGLDARLIGGAILFGIGWGLVGLCPGPAIVGLALGGAQSWLFAAAMLAGMALHGRLPLATSPPPTCRGPAGAALEA